jgi:integrase
VFYDASTGKRFTDVKKSFGTALKKAGIVDFRFHDLRHTFASHLVMGGVDITAVSKLLGHKSLIMTLRYSHLAPDHLSQAVNVLDITGGNVANATAQAVGQE